MLGGGGQGSTVHPSVFNATSRANRAGRESCVLRAFTEVGIFDSSTCHHVLLPVVRAYIPLRPPSVPTSLPSRDASYVLPVPRV